MLRKTLQLAVQARKAIIKVWNSSRVSLVSREFLAGCVGMLTNHCAMLTKSVISLKISQNAWVDFQ